jgi:predicted SnoaL-like aldol condensation-catalyzing enzyme
MMAMLSETEERNVERVKHWEWAWHDPVERKFADTYAEDCVFVNMMSGVTTLGREEMRTMERSLKGVDAERGLKITRTIASGDVVVVEIDATWKGGLSKACVVLTFDESGLIVSEHSYTRKSSTFTPIRWTEMARVAGASLTELERETGMSASQLSDLFPQAIPAKAAG